MSSIFPDKGHVAGKATWSYLKEMVFVLPAVMIAMGLFLVWVNREIVVKYLGEGSGPTGFIIAIALGHSPPGRSMSLSSLPWCYSKKVLAWQT